MLIKGYEEKADSFINMLGVKKANFPAIRAIQMNQAKNTFIKYKPEKDGDLGLYGLFLDQLARNKVKNYFKGE